jgi:acyl transferase domain-containing protein
VRDIAIIGMAVRLPEAEDLDAFWTNLSVGRESIRRFSPEALQASGVPYETATRPDYVPVKAELSNIDAFDEEFFGITPREAEVTDPQQRLLLTLSHEALVDAGYFGRESLSAGVFAGVGTPIYLLHNILSNPQVLATVGDYQLGIGNNKDYASLSVSYRLGLVGPSLTIQTACSTSLVAVHCACASLRAGECELALAGGVSLSLPRGHGYIYRTGGILSQDGHCRPFDVRGTGTVRGEGGAVVVLKRLDRALADRDNIYGVIRGSAVNNDGAAKVGFTAPSGGGQAAVIRAALASAELDASCIGYVEGHGTGTVLGDAVELTALQQVLSEAPRDAPCALGSLKSNLGHLDAAAGVVGLIKAALILQRGHVPPTLHFQQFSAELDERSLPFRVNTEMTPWQGPAPRRAGVSSFGIGGTNCHVVVEEPPARSTTHEAAIVGPHILPIAAATASALRERVRSTHATLAQRPELGLGDLAYSLFRSGERSAWPYRVALVARSREEALGRLQETAELAELPRRSVQGRPLLLLNGGAWSSPAAVDRFAATDPGFRESFSRYERALGIRLGALGPPIGWSAAGAEREESFVRSVSALLVLRDLLSECGITPQATAGVGWTADVALGMSRGYDLPTLCDFLWKAGGQSAGEALGDGHTVSAALLQARRGAPVLVVGALDPLTSALRHEPSLRGAVFQLDPADAPRSAVYQAVAAMWQAGAELNLAQLWASAPVSKVRLPPYPLKRTRHWIEPGAHGLAALHNGAASGQGVASRPESVPAPGLAATSERSWKDVADVEETLCALVGTALGREAVDGEMDFFAIGGDSLKAIELVARVKEVFQCEVGLADMLDAPSLRAQAAVILRERNAAQQQPPATNHAISSPPAPADLEEILREVEALSSDEVERELRE